MPKEETGRREGQTVRLMLGDSLQKLKDIPDCSIDAVVSDPPYGLSFMNSEWDAPWKAMTGEKVVTGGAGFSEDGMGKGFKALPSHFGSPNPCCQNCGGTQRGNDRKGFTRCKCESPEFPNTSAKQMQMFQAWCEIWAAECLRILKPGGVIKAFSGTRTFHRMAKAMKNVGFVNFETQAWSYGSGFPKSLSVSKALDKMAGAEREVVGPSTRHGGGHNNVYAQDAYSLKNAGSMGMVITAPATEAAKQWAGYGTALKPAFEPIVVARKPV